MQFRKLLPNAKHHDLIDIFNSRKKFFLRMIAKVQNRVDKKACFRKKVQAITNEEESDEPDDLTKDANARLVEEEEAYGFMMTKVRRAFR
jgi:hypothetical protein